MRSDHIKVFEAVHRRMKGDRAGLSLNVRCYSVEGTKRRTPPATIPGGAPWMVGRTCSEQWPWIPLGPRLCDETRQVVSSVAARHFLLTTL